MPKSRIFSACDLKAFYASVECMERGLDPMTTNHAMLENIPSQATMTELLGQSLLEVWQALCSAIDEKYEMERL